MIVNVTWDTDGHMVAESDLPTRNIEIPAGVEDDYRRDDDDAIAEHLSDTFGWLVSDWTEVE